MTIFYVDPVGGSNLNTGLSWAAAWKWIPGNGTPIVAGDTIRFAKSPERTTSVTNDNNNDGRMDDLFWTWGWDTTGQTQGGSVGDYGSSGGSGTVLLPANGTVPANTRLFYAGANRSVAGNSVFFALRYKNIPEGPAGTYIRVRLCSDSQGQTPVYDLESETWETDDWTVSVFRLDNGAPTTFSWGSVAIYSVGSFTVGPEDALITRDRRFLGIPNNPGDADYLIAGEAMELLSPRRPNIAQPAYIPEHYGWAENLTSAPYLQPPQRSGPSNSMTGRTTQFRMYAARPYAPQADYFSAVSYEGAVGNPVTLSGGWDTGTDTQNGYTNLGVYAQMHPGVPGAFIFSAGGNYLDFERFICPQMHLLYYDYTVSAISGLRLYDCTVGNALHADLDYDQMQTACVVSAAAISAPVAFDAYYAERCNLYDWFSFGFGRSGADVGLGKASQFRPHTDMTFGSVELVDCVVSDPGNAMGKIPCPSGNVTIRSSVAGEARSRLCVSNNSVVGSLRLAEGASGTLSISGTLLTVGTLDLSCGDGGAVSAASFSATDLYLTSMADAKGAYGIDVTVGNYLHTTLDGFGFDNIITGGGLATAELHIDHAAAFHTNNPTATLVWGGPVFSTANAAQTRQDRLRMTNPPATVDPTIGIRPWSLDGTYGVTWPGLIVAGWTGLVSVENFEGSYVHFELPTFTPGAYWPNLPTAQVLDGTCVVTSDLPIGVVRKIGGASPRTAPHNGEHKRTHPISQGMLVYGGSVDYLRDYDAGTGPFHDKRAMGVGITGTLIPYGYEASGLGRRPFSVILDEAATLEANPSSSNSDNYGFLARKASGWFHLRRAGRSVESAAPVNEYGKLTITMEPGAALTLARLDALAGQTLSMSVRLRCLDAISTTAYQRATIIVPPSYAYTAALAEHITRKNFSSNAEDVIVNFSATAQKTGEIFVNIYSTVNLEIKDFTVSAV